MKPAKLTDCHCYEIYSALPHGRVTIFTLDGRRHAVPSLWMSGRRLLDPASPAYHDWAWACQHGREDEQ